MKVLSISDEAEQRTHLKVLFLLSKVFRPYFKNSQETISGFSVGE